MLQWENDNPKLGSKRLPVIVKHIVRSVFAQRRITGIKSMHKRKLAVTDKDSVIAELVGKTDHKTLIVWACDCAERALRLFENNDPGDNRPKRPVEAGRSWAATDVYRMADIRAAALAAHTAAREVQTDGAARLAARAAGHAAATAHVAKHAIAAAIYAATALRDAVEPSSADIAAENERKWQLKHLIALSGR